MNKNKLKAKMMEHGDSCNELAKYLGIHRSCLSAKMNRYRGAEFTQSEIDAMIKRYNMTNEDVVAIFFEN